MIDLTKTGNFSSKLSPFIWMNFFPKSCKNWLISTKSRKIIVAKKFSSKLSFRLHKLFGVAKSGSFREKPRQVIDLAKTWERFEQTITFRGLDELFGKKLQKVAHFVKNHEKSSIWPKLATFQANYHISRFP